MLKKLNHILNVVIAYFIGAFAAYGLYVLWDYNAHTDLYAAQSAPWYTRILVYGTFTVVFLIIVFIIKLIVQKKLSKQ